jgi:hypothetical protein
MVSQLLKELGLFILIAAVLTNVTGLQPWLSDVYDACNGCWPSHFTTDYVNASGLLAAIGIWCYLRTAPRPNRRAIQPSDSN